MGLAALVAVAALSCPANLAGELASTRSAGQLITVEAPGYGTTAATLRLWRRTGGCWSAVAGPWPARLGRRGLSDHHREGDGTTPTGAYTIGPVMYGTAPDPGVRYAYHRLVCGDWWDEDPSSSTYNRFRHVACGARPPFHGDSEALWTIAAYRHFAVIRYNDSPVVPGRGSAIFLHDAVGAVTNGCVSVAPAQLDRILRWLRPASAPLIVIGTSAEIRRF
jgi:L,D-peptidoglycan transpeptidase YkuD (ErfK/YbiS/YcfS/YnhG family)